MTLLMSDLYFALLSAGASEPLARRAAEEAAAQRIEQRRLAHGPKVHTRIPASPMPLLYGLFALSVAELIGFFVLVVKIRLH